MSVFGWTARFGTLPTALFVCRLACLAHRCMELLAVLAAQNRAADGRNAASRNKKDVGVLPRPPTKRDSSVNDQFLFTELLSGSLSDLDGWEASPSHSEPHGSQQRTSTLYLTEQTKAVEASSPLVVHVWSPRVPPEQEFCRVHTEAQSHRPFVVRSRRLSGSPRPNVATTRRGRTCRGTGRRWRCVLQRRKRRSFKRSFTYLYSRKRRGCEERHSGRLAKHFNLHRTREFVANPPRGAKGHAELP